MKTVKFYLALLFLFALAKTADATCWVRNAQGKWYYLPTVYCKHIRVYPEKGERCIDCCAIQGNPVTPVINGNVSVKQVKLSNGDIELYDNASNQLITTILASATNLFDGTAYYSEEQGFGMKKIDNKSYLVSDDGEMSIELTDEGIQHIQTEKLPIKALVAEDKK